MGGGLLTLCTMSLGLSGGYLAHSSHLGGPWCRGQAAYLALTAAVLCAFFLARQWVYLSSWGLRSSCGQVHMVSEGRADGFGGVHASKERNGARRQPRALLCGKERKWVSRTWFTTCRSSLPSQDVSSAVTWGGSLAVENWDGVLVMSNGASHLPGGSPLGPPLPLNCLHRCRCSVACSQRMRATSVALVSVWGARIGHSADDVAVAPEWRRWFVGYGVGLNNGGSGVRRWCAEGR
ncbi:hypothetical protein BDZ97DRAFT_1858430 [Flammula alnicola]|nr:hypothetical protein BDZ97DRAFT_1858430 [Flammula alnicola]